MTSYIVLLAAVIALYFVGWVPVSSALFVSAWIGVITVVYFVLASRERQEVNLETLFEPVHEKERKFWKETLELKRQRRK